MSFLYPLGLLGLIGVPIVIIIYILKNKYTEQTIASTYLWRLSEKFLKKRKPLSKFSGILSLILQIIVITTISLTIAHPVISLPNQAKDYCFILDGSASMNYQEVAGTRLDLGKKEIKQIINDAKYGSTYTLVHTTDSSRIVYEKIIDKEEAIEKLESIKPTDIQTNSANFLNAAEYYFKDNKSLETYVVTDANYNIQNMSLINVCQTQDNYALSDVMVGFKDDEVIVTGYACSYLKDADLAIQVYVNQILTEQIVLSVNANEMTEFKVNTKCADYNNVKVVIVNEDGFLIDNEVVVHNVKKEHNYRVLIVSERPFYLEEVLKVQPGQYVIDVVKPTDYDADVSGYGLYIYDSFNPLTLPKDGTIWLFNLQENLADAGISVQETHTLDENGEVIRKEGMNNAISKKLLANLIDENIVVSKYVSYSVYGRFTSLFSLNGDPIIFTGNNRNGNRQVVFGFDLHDSNLPMLMNYLILMRNLTEYSFPTIIEGSNYACGDALTINVVNNCESIHIETPSGIHRPLDKSGDTTSYTLTEAGTYHVTVKIGDELKDFYVYASVPSNEGYTDQEVKTDLILSGEKTDSYRDGLYDKLIILFILLTVIFVADWMVYCYEQYQLR